MLNYSEINSRWSTPLLVRAEAIPNCTLCASIKATQRERETVRHVLLFILVPRRSLQNYLMKTWLGMLALDVKLKSFLRALPKIAVSKDFRGSQQRGSAGGKCPPPPPSTQLKRLHQSKSQPWWLQPLTQFVSQEQSGFVTDIFWPPPLLPARHFPWLGPGLLQGLALPLLPLQLCGLQQGAQPPSSGLPASRPASGISGFHRENKKKHQLWPRWLGCHPCSQRGRWALPLSPPSVPVAAQRGPSRRRGQICDRDTDTPLSGTHRPGDMPSLLREPSLLRCLPTLTLAPWSPPAGLCLCSMIKNLEFSR